MFYLFTILIAAAIIITLNYFFAAPVFGFTIWQIILYVSILVVAAIAIDGFFATVVRWFMPAKWFGVDKEKFAAGKRECRFYEKIGIKKWKEKVIELGVFTGFRKNKIADPMNNEYVARYILEANYGVGVHITGVTLGYLVMLIFPQYWLNMGLPVGVVNMVLNGLSLMILRYNLPKLRTLYRINAKRAARAEKQADSQDGKRNEHPAAS